MVGMRRYLLRVLKSGVPTALALAIMGYFLAQMAVVLHFEPSKTNPQAATTLTNQLESSLPPTMALWGFVLIALCELFRSLWRVQPDLADGQQSATTFTVNGVNSDTVTEPLLVEADAARRSHTSR